MFGFDDAPKIERLVIRQNAHRIQERIARRFQKSRQHLERFHEAILAGNGRNATSIF